MLNALLTQRKTRKRNGAKRKINQKHKKDVSWKNAKVCLSIVQSKLSERTLS